MLRKTFVLLLLLLGSSQLYAQSLEEILKKNIEARGGLDNFKKVKTFKAHGSLIAQGGTVQGEIIIFNKRPNLVRHNILIQGQEMVQAFDGETAWWIFPFMGDPTPQVMPEEQGKPMSEESDFDGHLVNYKEKGHQIELIGKEDMEGTEVFKLKCTLKSGSVQYYYLDSEYFIEIKTSTKQKMQGVEQEIHTYLSDYKEVDGLMMPHAIEQKVAGNTTVQITITKTETNVEIEDDFFKMPETK